MTALNPFKKSLSTSKIGTGRFFTAGKLQGKNRAGLGGALRNARGAGFRSFARNLSTDDLATFQELIGDEMKKLPMHASGLPYHARARIMRKAEKMVRNGTISSEDKKDLKNIVDALKPGNFSSDAGLNEEAVQPSRPKERAVNFGVRNNKDKPLSPEAQKKIRAAIAVDVAREMEDEATGRKSNRVYSGNSLARQESESNLNQEPDDEFDDEEDDDISKTRGRGQKVELPDMNNLTDLDIG